MFRPPNLHFLLVISIECFTAAVSRVTNHDASIRYWLYVNIVTIRADGYLTIFPAPHTGFRSNTFCARGLNTT